MALQALYDVPAPAKLNLFLHVIGRRADGYHLLQSPMVLIDWLDSLHFERRQDGVLRRHDLGFALPADDLCLRAARALQQASGSSVGADISIVKRVPAGAGMGGGSSDAASTLLGLNRLWNLRWPRARLAALALQLGADVPFFVRGHNAFAEGIGEQLTPFSLAPCRFAVLKPPGALATHAIFSHPLLARDTRPVIVTSSFEDAGRSGFAVGSQQRVDLGNMAPAFGSNDLQAPAEDCCPEVAQAARMLTARYGNSRMTGSGNAVFARIASDGAAEPPMATGPEDDLPDLPSGWVGRVCRSLPMHPLVAWAD